MEKETEDRLTAFEMNLAYMEDFVSQIQNVTVDQAKTIDKLQKEIKLMSDRIRDWKAIFHIASRRIIKDSLGAMRNNQLFRAVLSMSLKNAMHFF